MNLRQEDGTRPFKVQRVGVHSDGGVARSDTTCAIPRADLVPGIRSDSIFSFVHCPRDCVFDIMTQRRRKTLEGCRKNRRHDTRANSSR